MASAPLTGVLFVALIVASFAIGGEPPDPDHSAEEVTAWWADHRDQAMAASVVESVAGVALIFFAASLRRALRRDEAQPGLLSVAAFGGGVVAAAGIGVDAGLRFAAAELVGEVDASMIHTISALWSEFFLPMILGLATLIIATSLAALSTRVIPMWMAILGLVLCLLLFTPVGFPALLASGLWIVAVSVLLWRRESTVTTPTIASPAGAT